MYDPNTDRFDVMPGSDAFASELPLRGSIPLSCDNNTVTERTLRGDVDGRTFNRCTFSDVRWGIERMADVTFRRCRFTGAIFDNLELENVTFEDCEALPMDDGIGLSFVGARFKEGRFVGCRLIQASFATADVSRVRIEGSLVASCDFADARFSRRVADASSVTDFALTGSVVRHLSLRRAMLSSTDFYATSLTACDMRGTDLQAANFARGVFREVDLTDAYLAGADLRGTEFDRTDLSRARDWHHARVDEDHLNGLLKALGFRP